MICLTCGQEKQEVEFPKYGGSREGRRPHCVDCKNQINAFNMKQQLIISRYEQFEEWFDGRPQPSKASPDLTWTVDDEGFLRLE